MSKKFNILIIGANSFLAKKLVQLIKEEYPSSIIDGVINKNKSHNLDKCYRAIYTIDQIPKKSSFNFIFLLASFIPYGKMNSRSKKLSLSNIELPRQVVSMFPKAKIVFSSSVSVYGKQNSIITSKNTPAPISEYAKSKLAGEEIISNHPSFTIVRFTSLLGKGMTTKSFIPQIIVNLKTNNLITLFGDGSRKQDYLHVSDAAKILLNAALHQSNSTLLGVSGRSYSNKEIAEKLLKIHLKGNIEFQGEDKTPSTIYSVNIMKTLGQNPISIDSMLKELYQ